ncbi:MAG: hypothetical protein OET90_02720 [Desulfuromonadales bacterium]|nr:hypothetical protein [Desulfuromonadales bacterium]
MLTAFISVVIGLVFGVGLYMTTSLNPMVPVIAGTVVFGVIYIIMLKQVMGKVNAGMEAAQRDMMANRPERAVQLLSEVSSKYANWQFFINKQMNSQIGMVYYLKRDFTKALEYLEKGFVRHWVAMAMLGVIYMKKNKTKEMIGTFDKAVAGTAKEPLLWNLYGYCLEKVGEKSKAISVMEKGLKKTKNHELLEANLELFKSGQKMKMQVYGDVWYQFHLEKQGAMIRKQTKAMQGRRKIVRR